jgi:hypothetical protein
MAWVNEETGMDFSIAQLDSLISKIERGLTDLVSKANELIRKIESLTHWIPFIGDEIKDLLEKFADLVTEFVGKIVKVLGQSHTATVFWELGKTWGAAGIAGQAGQIASTLAGQKQFSAEWQGIAGARFATAVSGQEPAVDTLQTRSNTVSSACTTIAQYGFIYYVAIGVAIVGCTLAVASALADPPIAPIAVIGAITAGVLAFFAATWALEMGVDAQSRNMQQAGELSDTFPNDTWPQAVATIASVSPSSGDGTYTVEPGDNLSEIAESKLGNPNLWPEIQAANPQLVPADGSPIIPGEVLRIPRLQKPADGDAS